MRVKPKILQIVAAVDCLFRPKTIEKLSHFSCITMYARKSFISDTATEKKAYRLSFSCKILSFECIALLSYDFLCQKLGNGCKKVFSSQCAL